jgi:CheY-like chemotaxis protein
MASSTANEGLAHRRVLVVEDEYFIADDMAHSLEKLGAEVVGPVPTRDRALAVLSSGERIDAAVLDINLREESVFPVAEILRQLGVPFVFATGYDESSIPAAYREVPRWEKPFKPDQLAKMLPWLIHSS